MFDMTRSQFSWLAITIVVIASLAGCATKRADVRVTASDGTVCSPLSGEPGDVIVLLFASPDCPIANAIAPEIERLHRSAAESGGRFYFVHARSDVTAERATTHAIEYGITSPVLLDTSQLLVAEMHATVTPEIVVLRFGDDGQPVTVYQGLVNNLYASLGNRRDQATEHYGREAIVAAVSGHTVEPSYRKPLGCFLEQTQ